jgi:4'-phosphopantetheinyl transferase
MTAVIYPVILPVPAEVQHLPPKQRVQSLSDCARQALALSAERLGVRLGPLDKDDRGAPIPCHGHFWSLSHKPDYVGGVVAPAAIGLDIERLRPCSAGLRRKTADAAEWALMGHDDLQTTFFRYWTAKEAVLKTRGEGLRDLSRCRIDHILGPTRLRVDYAGKTWTVEHFFFEGHVAAVAAGRFRVEWTLAHPGANAGSPQGRFS